MFQMRNMDINTNKNNNHPLPFIKNNPVGVGLRSPHYQDFLEKQNLVGWLEVHPENYFGGGAHRSYLTKIRNNYEISFHAVGLSLGSYDGISIGHLKQIKELINIFEPFQFSDHLSWSTSGNAHLNDLLPLPYNNTTLSKVIDNVNMVQDFLNMSISIENPSSYISYKNNELKEWDVLNEVSRATGCRILLDVNNVYVQSQNHQFDPHEYINSINLKAVNEIHLAGYSEFDIPNTDKQILIDTHSKTVFQPVWDLFKYTIKKINHDVPVLIEWDDQIPEIDILLGEAKKALNIIKSNNSDKVISYGT